MTPAEAGRPVLPEGGQYEPCLAGRV